MVKTKEFWQSVGEPSGLEHHISLAFVMRSVTCYIMYMYHIWV